MLLTKKQRNKERNRPKTIPRPPTRGGVIKNKTKQESMSAERPSVSGGEGLITAA